MKSYTSIEQSKKLAEFLSLESADMYYVDDISAEFGRGWHSQHIPCWSLASLLSVLPSIITRKGKIRFLTLEKAGAYNLYYKSPDRLDELWETKEDVVDACYEMILKLHEQKLL